MNLHQSSIAALHPLQTLIEQLSEREFCEPLRVISEKSVGNHTRHVLEFYDCLFLGLSSGIVNYDARQRNSLLETDKAYALETIKTLLQYLETLVSDVPLHLQVGMDNRGNSVPTSLYRELVYNSEHCVHHLALIRIAVETSFPAIGLPGHFGVASSTIQYQNASVASSATV